MKKNKKFIVETAKYRKKVEAQTLEDAVVKAFKRCPPYECGMITRAKELGGIKNEWYYWSTVVALKLAGYKIKNIKRCGKKEKKHV